MRNWVGLSVILSDFLVYRMSARAPPRSTALRMVLATVSTEPPWRFERDVMRLSAPLHARSVLAITFIRVPRRLTLSPAAWLTPAAPRQPLPYRFSRGFAIGCPSAWR